MNPLKEKIEAAQKPVPPAPPGYNLAGYWEKHNKDCSSWVAAIKGVKDGRFTLEFVDSVSIIWQSKKGEAKPCGFRRWILPDGLYKAAILLNAQAEKQYFFFTIANGDRNELTEEQAMSLLADDTKGLPHE